MNQKANFYDLLFLKNREPNSESNTTYLTRNINNFQRGGDDLLAFTNGPVAEFKEFERRFKFKPRFQYGWFHLKLYQTFQDLSRPLI